MDPITAVILGVVSLVGTIVGVSTNRKNNQFIEETNEDNQDFQRETNLQNHQWSLESAQWEYDHNKPQRQYADLLAAGITPAAAAQKVSGANVSYSPATAVAPQNMPKSTNLLNDSLTQVIDEIANYSSMSQAQASAEKSRAETHVITETGVKRAVSEIDKILADTMLSYAHSDVASSQTELNEANTNLVNEKATTEQASRKAIELSNEEKQIQLEFTRKTLEMSVEKTQAEIKLLSEQTAKLQEEIHGIEFENKYKEWRNTYIDTYGVAPDQNWENTLFKAIVDGNAEPLLDSFSESLRHIFDPETVDDKLPDWWHKKISLRRRKPTPQYSPIDVSLNLR
jgi:hypothetical protein